MNAPPSIRRAGDRAFLVELADNESVHRTAAGIRAAGHPRLAEIVPGHTTLLLVWEARAPAPDAVARMVAGARAPAAPPPEGRPLTLAVRYDGPDLEAVAATLGMSADEVVARHRAGAYRVAFIGFAPGFAYLVGGDPALVVARRSVPRTRVPAGALAIAGPYTAIYPRAAPGGWNLIGSCDAVLFDTARRPPALLEPGARVDLAAP